MYMEHGQYQEVKIVTTCNRAFPNLLLTQTVVLARCARPVRPPVGVICYELCMLQQHGAQQQRTKNIVQWSIGQEPYISLILHTSDILASIVDGCCSRLIT